MMSDFIIKMYQVGVIEHYGIIPTIFNDAFISKRQ